ncbi:hypothetical protein VEE65_16220 [Escherichia coli]|nr:hypothetical protein VEE65_16220 [Escherichia coli]
MLKILVITFAFLSIYNKQHKSNAINGPREDIIYITKNSSTIAGRLRIFFLLTWAKAMMPSPATMEILIGLEK